MPGAKLPVLVPMATSAQLMYVSWLPHPIAIDPSLHWPIVWSVFAFQNRIEFIELLNEINNKLLITCIVTPLNDALIATDAGG